MRLRSLFLALVTTSTITLNATNDEGFDPSAENFFQLEAKSYSKNQDKKKRRSIREQGKSRRNLNETTLGDSSFVSKEDRLFFRTDIGLGLLYFKQIQGNFGIIPQNFNTRSGSDAPFKGRLSYNRTPIYNFELGYRLFNHFSAGLSYMHQSSMTVQTPTLASSRVIFDGDRPLAFNQFASNLALDGLFLKLYVDSPWSLIFRRTNTHLFLGTGVGIGWQSWTSIEDNAVQEDSNYFTYTYSLKQKICTNALFTVDAGLRTESTNLSLPLSVLAGCRFNIWGQGRNIGKLSQQGPQKFGLIAPLSIKTVYQWAPYLGVQWNFPTLQRMPLRTESTMDLTPLQTQFNVGVGILFFKDIKGNLISKPNENGTTNNAWQSAPVTQTISYNRTPLFEYLVQKRFNKWSQLGVSYQTQSGVSIQTKPVSTNSDMIADYAQLFSYLSLNTVMLKGYLTLPLSSPHDPMQWTPYFAFGLGPSWQTWNRTFVNRTGQTTRGTLAFVAGSQPIHQKVVANVSINLDWGLQLVQKNPSSTFSILSGCKFNYWGQVRNIGELEQQASSSIGLDGPFRAKKLYQWAPYLGVQWNFPYLYSRRSYFLDGRDPNGWRPYTIALSLIQPNTNYFARFSAGVGMLYFSGVKGNFQVSPKASRFNTSTNVPMQGRLIYNRSPLFEYDLGAQLCTGLEGMLSYQHQGSVTIQSKLLSNNASDNIYKGQKTQFTADLLLDSIMLKSLYEQQKALVFKGCAYSPYFGGGVGVAWQTWKRVLIDQPLTFRDIYDTTQTVFRNKVCASLAFMLDAGIRMRSPYPEIGFSISAGMKFNFWGQARSIGKLSQSSTPKYGLEKPFGIRTIYQWAPYLGVNWNF